MRLGLGLSISTPFSPAFTPLGFTTQLQGWYRADKGVTLNGSNVSAWADQSGRGDANRNAVQATGALQPAFVASDAQYSGQPTINPAKAAGQFLRTGVWSVALVQPFTFFIVGHPKTLTTNQYAIDNISGGANSTSVFDGVGLGSVEMSAGTALSAGSNALNSPSFIYAIFNGSSSAIARNAKTAQATGAAGAQGATGLTIGDFSGGGAFSWDGPLAEIVVVSGAVSAADISNMAAYVTNRYGIAIAA